MTGGIATHPGFFKRLKAKSAGKQKPPDETRDKITNFSPLFGDTGA